MKILGSKCGFFRFKFEGSIDDRGFSKGEFAGFDEDIQTTSVGFINADYPKRQLNLPETIGGSTVFGLRIDTKIINKAFYDGEVQDACDKFLIESGKDRLSKSDKEFIKNAVKIRLLKTASIGTKVVECFIDNNILYTTDKSVAVTEALYELFKYSFGVYLEPYNVAEVYSERGLDGNPEDFGQMVADALVKMDVNADDRFQLMDSISFIDGDDLQITVKSEFLTNGNDVDDQFNFKSRTPVKLSGWLSDMDCGFSMDVDDEFMFTKLEFENAEKYKNIEELESALACRMPSVVRNVNELFKFAFDITGD